MHDKQIFIVVLNTVNIHKLKSFLSLLTCLQMVQNSAAKLLTGALKIYVLL